MRSTFGIFEMSNAKIDEKRKNNGFAANIITSIS